MRVTYIYPCISVIAIILSFRKKLGKHTKEEKYSMPYVACVISKLV